MGVNWRSVVVAMCRDFCYQIAVDDYRAICPVHMLLPMPMAPVARMDVF